MFKSFFKKLFLILFLGLIGGIAASFLFIADPPKNEIANAIDLGDPAKNIFGWAWSENIGWIGFNCIQSFCSDNRTLRCSSDSDCDGTCEFDTVDCLTSSNYGVSYDSGTGNLSGYAWGDNIGWIDFDAAGPYPDSPNNSVQYNSGTGLVTGWAQIVNSEGWIKFDHDQSDPVTISDNEFYGWAWNENDDETGVGWISFNCVNESECGSSDYKVYINHSSLAENLIDDFSSACSGGGISVTLSWDFSDSDTSSSQSAYEIEVRDSVGALVLDTGKVISATDQRIVDSGLGYNETYDWKVKVWDNYNLASEWAEETFTTPEHQYPSADFTWGPSVGNQGTSFSPRALEDVFFADTSVAYEGASITDWAWTFADALPNASTTLNPGPVQFQSAGDKEVVLTVTDSDGYSCDFAEDITSQMSLPIWEEVKPE